MEHFFNLMLHLEFFRKYKEGPKANEGDEGEMMSHTSI